MHEILDEIIRAIRIEPIHYRWNSAEFRAYVADHEDHFGSVTAMTWEDAHQQMRERILELYADAHQEEA